jgi:ribosomal-protein-alanine N-acetyltransferase
VDPYSYTDSRTGITYEIGAISELDAVAIADWEYEPPYTMYNLGGSPLAILEFLTGPYYSVKCEGVLVGFFCFGSAARVKHQNSEYLYRDSTYLDVGLGLHPKLCGQGYGLGFLEGGLRFAQDRMGAARFRLTAVSDNFRAIKVYLRAGFKVLGSFERPGRTHSMEFVVMVYDPRRKDAVQPPAARFDCSEKDRR